MPRKEVNEMMMHRKYSTIVVIVKRLEVNMAMMRASAFIVTRRARHVSFNLIKMVLI